MTRFPLWLITLVLVLFHTSSGFAWQDKDFALQAPSGTELYIDYTPSEFTITDRNENLYHIEFYKNDYIGLPGEPQIPARTLVIGIPPQGDISLDILESDYQTRENITLAPVPYPRRNDIGYTNDYTRKDSIYRQQTYLPHALVEVQEQGEFRQQRIAKLVFYPIQFNPAEKKIRQYSRIRIRVSFPATAPASLTRSADENFYRYLVANYEQARVWRQAARLTKAAPKPAFQGSNWARLIIRTDGQNSREGLYKVTGEALSKAGIAISQIDPATIQLFNNGGKELPQNLSTDRPDSLIENPILVFDGGDGSFDSGDYILFYGKSVAGKEYRSQNLRHYINHYTYDNVYWFTHGKSAGKRIRPHDSLPNGDLAPEASFRDLVFWEKEQHNILNSGFNWFGQQLSSSKNALSYAVDIPKPVANGSATCRVNTAVTTPGTHTFRFYLQSTFIFESSTYGSGGGYITRDSESVFSGTLVDGQNSLSVHYNPSSDISIAYMDWFEIEYDRKFEAVGDQLVFFAPTHGDIAAYALKNFSRNDIAVYDVTDISDIRAVVNTSISNGQVLFADSTSTETARRYIAVTGAAYRTVDAIEKHEVTELRTPDIVDYIIITPDQFYQQAMQLESLRETLPTDERLATRVVRISDIYDQFSWGLVDVTAIRDFLVFAQDNWGNPRYVLLFGDGHYDYKNLLGYDTPNLILPYETADRSEISSRTTDDWFTYTRSNAGMQMAIGRIPVQTIADAQAVVDKIIQYETAPEYGEWRKTVTLVADDELVAGGQAQSSDTIHVGQTETLAEDYVPDLIDVKKIYLMEYPAVRNASVSGVTKPTATEDLLTQINQGSLIINYIGHGNDELWSHERVLNAPTDFERIQNGKRMALWVAATCEFAYWDQPQKQSFAERIMNAQNRGSIAMVSSSRLAFSNFNSAFNNALYDELFKEYASTGKTKRIGDAVMLAKQRSTSRSNSEKYNIFGDPCMRLGAPQFRATVNDVDPDSIQALRKLRVSGHIERDGQIWSGYNGDILVRVIDSRQPQTYVTEIGSNTIRLNYILPGNSIFRGVSSIENGLFDAELIVPKDISYGGTDGRISLYFWDGNSEGAGYQKKLPVGGTAIDLVDHTGPEIDIHFGDPAFADGDYTTTNPLLHVDIQDSLSGVNIAGDIGHQITLVLDENEANIKNITEFFQYDANSYLKGSLSYPLYQLEPGEHQIRIKAWDNSNNSSIATLNFVAVQDSTLLVRNLLNWPNPMTSNTTFTFELSHDAMVSLKIFSVSGRLLKKFEPYMAEIGFNALPQVWDGTDQDGDYLANGVYLYKLSAKSIVNGQSHETDKIGKCIIAR